MSRSWIAPVALVGLLAAPVIAHGDAFRAVDGIQSLPRATAPGKAAARGSLWINSGDSNRWWYTTPGGTSAVVGGGSGTVTADSPISGDGSSGTPLQCPTCVVTSGSYADPSWITSLAASKLGVMTGASSGANGAKGAAPQPVAGQQSSYLRGDASWATAVSSVGITMPSSVFSSGSAVTTSGNLSAQLLPQTANTFFAGPASTSQNTWRSTLSVAPFEHVSLSANMTVAEPLAQVLPSDATSLVIQLANTNPTATSSAPTASVTNVGVAIYNAGVGRGGTDGGSPIWSATGVTVPGDGTLYTSPTISVTGNQYVLAISVPIGSDVFTLGSVNYGLRSLSAASVNPLPSDITTVNDLAPFTQHIQYSTAKPRILIEGDSIAQGVGVGFVSAFPELLSSGRGLAVDNVALQATRLNQWAGLASNSFYLKAGELAPDVWVEEAGINDLPTLANLADFQNRVSTRMSQIHAIQPSAVVVWVNILPSTYYGAYDALRVSCNAWLATLPYGISAIADVDASNRDPTNPAQQLPSLVQGDGLHPNASGQVIMANTVYAAITAVSQVNAPTFRSMAYADLPGAGTATPTFSTTMAIDCSSGATLKRILMTASMGSWTMPAGNSGQPCTVEWIQDATGSRTIGTPPANVRFSGGTPTLTTTANKRDTFTFRYDATDALWVETARATNL